MILYKNERENNILIEKLKEKLTYQNDIIKSKDDNNIKEIKSKDDMLKSKDDIIKSKDETILTLTHENANLKTLLNNAGQLMEKSMSTLNYITKNYNEAPALEYITNIATLHDDLSEENVVQTVIDQYKNNTLVALHW